MMRRILLPVLAVILAASSVASAAAWYGDFDSDFANPLNWDTSVVPTGGEIRIKAVPISPISNPCTISTTAAGTYVLIVENGGIFNIQCPGQGGGGTPTGYAFQIGSSSASSYISNGTVNVYPASGVTSLRSWGLYLGTSANQTGTLTIEPGASMDIRSGSTFTIGGSNSGTGGNGVLNLYGNISLSSIRLNWNNSGSYLINLYPGCRFYYGGSDATATFNAGIAAGRIVSPVAGYVPVADYNSVDNYTQMTAIRSAKAMIPSPANGASISGMNTPSQPITLSWTNPLPEDPTKPITSDVYITNDPNFLIGVTQLASGISGTSVSTTVNKLQTYYWRVDSTDPNKTVPLTTGDIWSFNTNNTAPSVGISAPYQTAAGDVALWLPGNTSATVSSVITDDGYPIGGPVSYQWMYDPNNNGTGTVVSTSPTMNVTYTSVTPGTTVSNDYRYRLTVSDGQLTTVRTFLVRLFVNTCVASARLPGYSGLTGEFNGDCKVSFTDFATFASNWGQCNALGGLCN